MVSLTSLCRFSDENAETALQFGVIMFFLPPNTTPILQPIDVKVLGKVRARFWKLVKARRPVDGTFRVHDVLQIFDETVVELQKQRGESGTSVWDETCKAAFRDTGIVPLNRNAIPLHTLTLAQRPEEKRAEAEVKAELELNQLTAEELAFFSREDPPATKGRARRKSRHGTVARVLTTEGIVAKLSGHPLRPGKKRTRAEREEDAEDEEAAAEEAKELAESDEGEEEAGEGSDSSETEGDDVVTDGFLEVRVGNVFIARVGKQQQPREWAPVVCQRSAVKQTVGEVYGE